MHVKFAVRYLLSPKSHSVINMVGIVSLVAVCIPVAAMVILLSVFNGFENLVGELNSAVDSDIEITSAWPESTPLFSPSSDFIQRLEEIKGVENVCTITEGKAFIQRRDVILPVNVRGIDSLYRKVIDIDQFMEIGKDLKYIRGAVIGEALRVQLGIYLTDEEIILRTIQGGKVGSVIPFGYSNELNAKIYGFFHIDEANDQQLVLVDKSIAKDLFQKENPTSILVRVATKQDTKSVKEDIKRLTGEEAVVQTRQERNALAYYVMKMEKWGIFLICLLVLIIASMSIIGLISIMIVEKRDEQTIIKAMGGTSSFLRRIFIWEGMILSWAGGLMGVILGILVVMAQKYLHLVKLPSSQFLIEDYPVELHLEDIIWVILSFAVISLIFSSIAVRKNIEK